MPAFIISSLKRLAVAGAAVALVASPALAEPSSETFSFQFSYSGASLKSDAGARAAYAQLSVKARAACRGDTRMALVQHRTVGECANNLINQTVGAINSPKLSQVHTGVSAIQYAAQ